METKPISKREYLGLLSLVGGIDSITDCIKDLDARGQTDHITQARDIAADALHDICMTIPQDKLRRIRADMDNTKVYVKTEAPGIKTVSTEHHRYLPTATVNKMVQYIAEHECYLCDKTAVEGRHCPVREMLEDALPHELEYRVSDGRCKWSGLMLDLGEWEDEAE